MALEPWHLNRASLPKNRAVAAEPSQTMGMKAGCCYIRTSGTLYTYEPYADLRIDLTQGATTLTTASRGVAGGDSTDGRDEVLQEQLMSLPCLQERAAAGRAAHRRRSPPGQDDPRGAGEHTGKTSQHRFRGDLAATT